MHKEDITDGNLSEALEELENEDTEDEDPTSGVGNELELFELDSNGFVKGERELTRAAPERMPEAIVYVLFDTTGKVAGVMEAEGVLVCDEGRINEETEISETLELKGYSKKGA